MDKQDVTSVGSVGVLMGGCSSEREISFKSGKAVLKALLNEGVDARAVTVDSEETEVNKRLVADSGIRIGFIAMHGRYGEDGGIQTVLEEMGIPYVGSGPGASRMAMNKILTQRAFKEAGLPIPDFCVFERGAADILSRVQNCFQGEPVVVKPAAEGSSLGVCIVRDYARLEETCQQAFEYGGDVLVERFIQGRELTVGILEDRDLPVVEIRAPHGFFDFESKYRKGATEYHVPASLDASTARYLGELSLRAFHVIGCRDCARVDILLTDSNIPYLLEINTIPGFTETSLLPMAAACAGYDFSQLCLRLVLLARERAEFTGRGVYGETKKND